jgi:hypothetical protein
MVRRVIDHAIEHHLHRILLPDHRRGELFVAQRTARFDNTSYATCSRVFARSYATAVARFGVGGSRRRARETRCARRLRAHWRFQPTQPCAAPAPTPNVHCQRVERAPVLARTARVTRRSPSRATSVRRVRDVSGSRGSDCCGRSCDQHNLTNVVGRVKPSQREEVHDVLAEQQHP